jgi:hypothetical protein
MSSPGPTLTVSVETVLRSCESLLRTAHALMRDTSRFEVRPGEDTAALLAEVEHICRELIGTAERLIAELKRRRPEPATEAGDALQNRDLRGGLRGCRHLLNSAQEMIADAVDMAADAGDDETVAALQPLAQCGRDAIVQVSERISHFGEAAR